MDNHIQEYFVQKEALPGNELFRVNDNDLDLKSEVTLEEHRLINILMANDDFLASRGLKNVYKSYYNRFLRLKVSLDRKGRGEFVQVNQKDNSTETIRKLGDFNNLIGPRK